MKPTIVVRIVVTALLGVMSMASCLAAVSQADLDAMQPGLVQGCRDSYTGLRSGKGAISIRIISYSYEGDEARVNEVLGTYDVAFDGLKYKIAGQRTYIRNEQMPHSVENKDGSPWKHGIANDGEKITVVDSPYTGSVGSATGRMSSQNSGLFIMSALPRGTGPVGGQGFYSIDVYPRAFSDSLIDKGLRAVRLEEMDGHECVVVERKAEQTSTDGLKTVITRAFWIDPNRGFCVPLVQVWEEGGRLTERSLVGEIRTTLRNYGNGLWGPKKCVYTSYMSNGKGGTRNSYDFETTYADDYQLNIPINPADLILKIPATAILTDVDKAAP